MTLVAEDLRAISGVVAGALQQERQHTEVLVRRVVSEELDSFAVIVNEGFAEIQERFEAIDRRFDAMDDRFDAMDERFDAMDVRFNGIDQRLNGVDRDLDDIKRGVSESAHRSELLDLRQRTGRLEHSLADGSAL